MTRAWAALALAVALLVAGCTSGGSGRDVPTVGSPSAPSASSTAVPPSSSSAAPSSPSSSGGFAPATPIALAALPGLPPGAPVPSGYVQGDCPYLPTATAQDLEGNRIYRTVVTTAQPVSCRFYFWCCDYHATLDVQVQVLPSADSAYNTMVLTGQAGANVTGVHDLVPGVDAVLFQTPFYANDAGKDWAAAFAKDKTVVVVRTDQTDVSFNARRIAAAIAPKF
jgi:predicted small secreted protein